MQVKTADGWLEEKAKVAVFELLNTAGLAVNTGGRGAKVVKRQAAGAAIGMPSALRPTIEARYLSP